MARTFEQPADAHFMCLVLSERPKDFPDAYVVRAHVVFPGELAARFSSNVMLFQTEAEARRWVAWEYPDFEEQGRSETDQPQTLTVWVERQLVSEPN